MATRLTYRALPGTRMGTRQTGILAFLMICPKWPIIF